MILLQCSPGCSLTIHYMIDYDPVKFINPKDNVTLVYNNLDSKLIECSTTGSVKPKMSWVQHGSINLLGSDAMKRIHTVDASSSDLCTTADHNQPSTIY